MTRSPDPGILPAAKTTPHVALVDQKILLYGLPKTGKTTFAAGAPEPLFLAFEAGLNNHSVFAKSIERWETAMEVVDALYAADGDYPYKTLVIDTIDMAYNLCSDFVCRKLGIPHPSDAPYGKGWGAVKSELIRFLNAVGNLPMGAILISHAKVLENTENGVVSYKATTTLSDSVHTVVTGFVDMIAYAQIAPVAMKSGEAKMRHCLCLHPTAQYDAGCRIDAVQKHMQGVMPLEWSKLESAYTAAVSKAYPPAAQAPIANGQVVASA